MTISDSAKAAAQKLPPDVLMHPMPFPDRLDYAEKIIQEAIYTEMEKGRQWNALLELELANLRSIKPVCYVCEQLMEQRGEDATDYICVNCDRAYRESQKMLARTINERDALQKELATESDALEQMTMIANGIHVDEARAAQLLTMAMKWGLNGAPCYDAALATNTGDEIREFLAGRAAGVGVGRTAPTAEKETNEGLSGVGAKR